MIVFVTTLNLNYDVLLYSRTGLCNANSSSHWIVKETLCFPTHLLNRTCPCKPHSLVWFKNKIEPHKFIYSLGDIIFIWYYSNLSQMISNFLLNFIYIYYPLSKEKHILHSKDLSYNLHHTRLSTGSRVCEV